MISSPGNSLVTPATFAMVLALSCRDAAPPSDFIAHIDAAPQRQDTVRRRLNAGVAQGRQSAIVEAAARVSPGVPITSAADVRAILEPIFACGR